MLFFLLSLKQTLAKTILTALNEVIKSEDLAWIRE